MACGGCPTVRSASTRCLFTMQVRQLAEEKQLITARTVLRSQSRYKTFTDVVIPRSADTSECPFAAPELPPCQNLFFIPSQVRPLTAQLQARSGAAAHFLAGSAIVDLLFVSQMHAKSEDVGALQQRNCAMKLVLWRSDSNHLCGMVPDVSPDDGESDIAQLEPAFGAAVPDWMLSQLKAQLQEQAPAPFGAVITCSDLHTRGGVVLLGDAAHAVTSTLGQGANMALESVGIFHNLLSSKVANGTMPLAAVPAAFTATRRRDVHAMQRLEELSNVAQGSAPARTPAEALHARVAFGSAIIIGTLQWKLMPKQFETLPLYRMLYDEETPYSDILGYMNRTAGGMYVVLFSALASACINFVEFEIEGFPLP